MQRRDWSGFDGPGAEHFHREEIELPEFTDPVEPMNRGVAVANHGFILGLIDPVSRIYRLLLPKFLRDRISDFADNLIYPRRLIANLLQGKWADARDETYRFGINTTIGLAGFFDPAGRWGIEPSDEDFGQTFATWGWRRSTFLMLPIYGPSNVRDGLGLIPDSLLNPATYFFPAGPFLTFNDKSEFVPFYRRFTYTNHDPYHLARLLYALNRDRDVRDYDYEPEDTAAVQTLRSVFLSYRDPSFPARLRTGRVEIDATGRRLPYSYRLQEGAAPVVFLIPGLGAHRLGDSSLGLAELAWDRGFSVVVVSSAFNFEFMEVAATVPVPGHAPVDARDTHRALDAIHRHLEARHPGRLGARALMGYSLGGFHAMFIAASESDPGNEWIRFDRYLALDTPVDLLRGVEVLDRFFNAPLVFPPEERESRIRAILRKTVDLARRGLEADDAPGRDLDDVEGLASVEAPTEGGADFTPEGPLPFSSLEAEFLIGLAFRLTLLDAIFVSQQREDLGVLESEWSWFRRWAVYEEISEYSFAEYMYAFVLPYYRDRLEAVPSERELIRRNDLRSLAPALRASGKIRVFANSNDFLTNDEDLTWLRGVLGPDRARFFAEGGHLGNLYRPDVQAEVMRALEDLAPAR